MDWTQYTAEPRSVTGIYGEAPSLERFALEHLSAYGREVTLRGDLAQLPEPLPPRWETRGYTRAELSLKLSEVVECEITGVPDFHFDGNRCVTGDPVDLSVALSERTWSAPDGTERAFVEVVGESPYLRFRMLGRELSATVDGYVPGPY
jgi:hypothetical protein